MHTALTYIIGSIHIGPALYLAGYHLVQTTAHCTARGLAYGAEVLAARAFQVSGAGGMLMVGIPLLVRLWTARWRIGLVPRILCSLGVVIMMLGYAFVVAAGLHPPSCTW